MGSEIKTGDRVRYKAGRGYGAGRVANVDGTFAVIETGSGKQVRRKQDTLERISDESADKPSED